MSKLKSLIQNWLDIQNPKEPILPKDLEKKYQQLITDMEYWHRTFKSFSVVPCAYCNKQMRIYPYDGAYYLIKDNQKVHVHCYNKYLAEKN